MESPKKIVISGYYGYGNLGDEAILESLIASLRDRFNREDLEIVILSNNPENTEEEHGVAAVNRWGPIAVIKLLRRADLLISGGGGLLQDRTSSFSLWYYLGIIQLAGLFSTPAFVLGQGIGPVEKKYNRYFLRISLAKVKGFLVRDERSEELLKSLGIEETRIIEGEDLAFFLPPKERSPDDFYNSPHKEIVAAALRDDVRGRSDIVRAVSSGLDMLHEKFGANIVLFSTNSSSDRPINSDLDSSTDAYCNIIDVDHLSPSQLVEMMRGLDLVIAGRLHTLIFSFLSGTPVQGISYDPKMDYLIEEANQLEPEGDFSLWHPQELINATEYLSDLESIYERKSELMEAAVRVKNRLSRQGEKKLDRTLDWIERELEDET